MTDFAEIAPYYDRMTGFDKRLVNDFGVIKLIVEKFGIKKAVDAGCGTGVHTIILAKMGVEVTGLDASGEMLDLARKNALNAGVEINLEKEFIESMPHDWTDSYDAVFCLANSLVGVQTGERLALALKSFQRVLKPGGKAIIQVLNFVNFRHNNRRIIKVSTDENLTFVRFFDFDEKETRLNVLIIEHDMGRVNHRFISEAILPVNVEVIATAAKIARFSDIEFFTDLSLSEPYSLHTDNMVIVLTR